MIYEVVIAGKNDASSTFRVELATSAHGSGNASRSMETRMACKVDGNAIGAELDARMLEGGVLSLLMGGKSYEIRRDQVGEQIEIQVGEERYTVEVRDPRSLSARRSRGASGEGPKKITAPMPGKVIRIVAPEGTKVEAGEGVIVIEAMKMQNELKSPKAGVVKKVMAVVGATVNPGDALAIVE